MTDKKKMNIKSLIQPLSQVEGEWQASPEYGELPKNGIQSWMHNRGQQIFKKQEQMLLSGGKKLSHVQRLEEQRRRDVQTPEHSIP